MQKVVKPYEPDSSKKEQVSKMFDNIAPKYDLLNRVLSLGIDTIWRKKMIEKIRSLNPKQILDVATGTGDVALEAQKRLKPDFITGVDISHEMLEVGREKIRKKGLTESIRLDLGDSENLPYDDNSFDAVTVAFGVRNYENLEKGMREMNRVLRPGGKLVVLEFSRPTIFPFKQLYNFYFKNILPTIGKLTSKDQRAYTYLYESVQAFPDGDDFLAVMNKTGYSSPDLERLTLGICTLYTGVKN
ncbi:MAG: demethylmenaquinone methyltransferase/2-methoxy-6-polyprenyl-1,4-benzoquinol methylase [Saprospiraceae bacterium]